MNTRDPRDDLHELARTHGGEVHGDAARIPTPGHSRKDRGASVKVRADGQGLVVHSFNHAGADWRDLRKQLGIDIGPQRPRTPEERREWMEARERAKQAERRQQQARLDRAAALWRAGATPKPGGPVCTYLAARGLNGATVALTTRAGAAIREHRNALGHVSMLAIASDDSGRGMAVHLTKLEPDGSGKRAGEDMTRLSYGLLTGTSVRLIEPVGVELAIAEGVETALAFFELRRIPTWAALGAGNLARFTAPPEVKTLFVAADGDVAGAEAAKQLQERMRRQVRVVIAAAPPGADWNDVLARGAR